MTTVSRTLVSLGLAILAAAPLRSQRRSDVLTAEEIEREKGKGGTVYDAVQALRPRWLKTRELILTGDPNDMVDAGGPHVYLEDRDQGDADYLKTIPVELVAELRWLSANRASSRYGPTSNPGIVVILKR
jgi:hypothetical protein